MTDPSTVCAAQDDRTRNAAANAKRCTYLLPIRRSNYSLAEAEEFRAYFETLNANGCEVLVVDGSPPEGFDKNGFAWANVCDHRAVDRRFGFLNDKVNGIHTGVELASCEKIL